MSVYFPSLPTIFCSSTSHLSREEIFSKLTEALDKPYSEWSGRAVAPLMKKLEAGQIFELFEHVAKNPHFLADQTDPFKSIAWLIHQLSPEQITALNPVDFAERAKLFHEEAKYQCQRMEEKSIGSALQSGARYGYQGILSLFNGYISSYGLSELLEPAESDHDAHMRSWKFRDIFYALGGVSLFLSQTLPEGSPIFLLIGSIIFALAALEVAYKKFLKPAPWQLPCAENWTYQAIEGSLSTVEGRDTYVDKIAHALIQSKKIKAHPLLLGETGVGKTATIKALTHAIAHGKYPELKGKQIHYINTADIVGRQTLFDGNRGILKQISKEMGRHRENIILVFDEIHLLCKDGDTSYIGEQMKTLLDEGKENLPYVIGLTTEEEFRRDIHLPNPAFSRRFQKISLESMGHDESVKVLSRHLLSHTPEILVDPSIVETCFNNTLQQFPDAPQPYISLEILNQCIKQVQESQKTDLDKDIELQRNAIEAISSQATLTAEREQSSNQDEELKNHTTVLKELENQKVIELKKRHEVDALLARRVTLKQNLYKQIEKVNAFGITLFTKMQKHDLVLFNVLHDKVLPALVTHILGTAKSMKLQVEITPEILKGVLEEEKGRRSELETLMAQAKESSESRNQKAKKEMPSHKRHLP